MHGQVPVTSVCYAIRADRGNKPAGEPGCQQRKSNDFTPAGAFASCGEALRAERQQALDDECRPFNHPLLACEEGTWFSL
jgi:hypothetical protein